MARIFVQEDYREGQVLRLGGEQAHYLRDVLRLSPGDEFVAVLPDGCEAQVTITNADAQGLEGQVLAVTPPSPPPGRLLLYTALSKHKRFEWMLQKVTEVGTSEIFPLLTERAVVRPRAERLPSQVARWNKITEAAARQCESPSVPAVHSPTKFAEALQHWQAQQVPGLMFTPATREQPEAHLKQVLADLDRPPTLALFLGPEGGFSPAEIAAATAAGLQPVSLGPRILRAETAAVVAVALCLYELSHRD